MRYKKHIFNILHNEIKLTPKVISYADETSEYSIDIYIGENRPDIGLSTYSTIGLSNYPINVIAKDGREIRIEYIGMCKSSFNEFPNIVASCAFNIIKDNYSCMPGMVAINAISSYCNELEMKHIYYTTPIYWDNLQGVVLNDNIVNWLLMVPISDEELDYLNKNGEEEFEKIFEKEEVDVFDIYRKSIV